MRVGAIQLEVKLGDIDHNLGECERLARAAAAEGAQLVALPEFFSTGVAYLPELSAKALPPDGAATSMLTRVAAETGIWVGGSFLCRDTDGEVRNAWLLAGPDGEIHGRHNKDRPTMWENAFYIGGDDDGVIETGDFTVGAAVCWEFMRTDTARRLTGRVDLVVGGSNWWSIPAWAPRAVTRRMEAGNARTALRAPSRFGRFVGAPIVHGAICGAARCAMPELPGVTYQGHFEGGALISDAAGEILALRHRDDGSGFVIGEIEVERSSALEAIPDRFWLHPRGPLPAVVWNTQRLLGQRWYRRHGRKLPNGLGQV